ncbi:MAG TPA: histidine kinase [Chryseolinea sp.]|nr:histidine kinase [Chryseolinea sp.]HPM31377.1 histidine kinase [Chryseolinea sp.]
MKKFFQENYKPVLWMTAAGFAMPTFVCSSCLHSLSKYLIIGLLNAIMWIALWLGNAALGQWVDTKISWFERPVMRFIIGMISMTLYTIGIIYFILVLFEFVFNLRLIGDDLVGTFKIATIITFCISFFMHSRAFLLNWKQASIDTEILKKESIAAKYESLKNQVNPHFLFNSFNALTNLVYEDQDKAVQFIKQLSDVYRYVLDTRDKEVVSLEEEKKFLESYLYLQQIRFGDKLKLEVKLDGVKSMVAPLVLQMLVENSIKHNIISEENPLTIRVYSHDHFIVIENNLQKKTIMEEDSPGIGLDNIQKRYEFLSDTKVEVIRNEMFIVKLPIIPESK